MTAKEHRIQNRSKESVGIYRLKLCDIRTNEKDACSNMVKQNRSVINLKVQKNVFLRRRKYLHLSDIFRGKMKPERRIIRFCFECVY